MPRRNYGMAHPSLVRDAADDLDARVAVLEDLEARPSRWATQSSLEAFMLRANARLTTLEAHLGYGAPMPAPHMVLITEGERLVHVDKLGRITPVDLGPWRTPGPHAAPPADCPLGAKAKRTIAEGQASCAVVCTVSGCPVENPYRIQPSPPVDPRIDHLCWVWDVERLYARIQRVTKVDFHRDFPFTDSDDIRWKHAELVRPEEL